MTSIERIPTTDTWVAPTTVRYRLALTAWRALRDAAGLRGVQFHDLRHTVITELAEMGVADHVLRNVTSSFRNRRHVFDILGNLATGADQVRDEPVVNVESAFVLGPVSHVVALR